MLLLQPNSIYTINGVAVCEKIIPDGTRWSSATKASAAGFAPNSLYKKQSKLTNNSGRPMSITIHNTEDLGNVHDDAEQYTRATYNENMGSARIHFYVDDVGAWQNLKAGTGMCENDQEGSAEVSWHAGDGSIADGGNMTSLSIELIMGDVHNKDEKAYENGARLAAWLLWKHNLDISALVTHTYWVNKATGKNFDNVDEQCTNLIYGKKWCPMYILGSTNKTMAIANWRAFKVIVEKYLYELKDISGKSIFKLYLVKVGFDKIDVRNNAGNNNEITASITNGVFTIVAETGGVDGSRWGKLKSGIGWIPLDKIVKL